AFGGDGQVDLPFEFPTQVIPLNDGDVLILGETSVTTGGQTDTTFFLTRLNADGTPDNGFGTNGVLTLNSTLIPDAFRFPMVAVQSDGKIIVDAWTSKPAGGPGEGVIAESTITRLNADGTRDNAF